MREHGASFRERFRFQSQAAHWENALHVVRFSGTEGLSTLYEFDIVLATQRDGLPLERMLAEPARLVILREDGRHATFSGLPTSIQQTTRYNGWTFYRLTLRPAFWKFTQMVRNSFHVDRDIREIIEASLDSIEYFDVSREFRLHERYDKQEFSMQHNESTYDFLAWKLERDGICYFFDEQDDGERIVFADSPAAHAPLAATPVLAYSPTSGLEGAHGHEVITAFSLNVSPLPRQVVLRDYDYARPGTPVVAGAEVSPHGLGSVYYYGEGFTTEAEGERLARIRAQALACRGRVFSGESSAPTLRPGHGFRLTDHYDEGFNREYTLVTVTHEGGQEAWLSQAVGVPIDRENDRLFYRNAFTCIPADVRFRPERRTERARVAGMLSAFVDASSKAGTPEIDGMGRYKVVFPQDDSGRGQGRASCWLRRMQPHVGKWHGTVLPLSPGVEVMVAFVDGNPDRPFIAGAVANAETATMESPASSELTGLRADGGNALLFHNRGARRGVHLTAGGASGISMSSGSLDTLLQRTDYAANACNAFQSSFAGLGSSIMGAMESSISANLGTVTAITGALIPAVNALLTGIESACKAYAKADVENHQAAETVAGAAGIVNDISKTLSDLIKMGVTIATMGDRSRYGVAISANSNKARSIVTARNYPSIPRLLAILTATVPSILFRYAADIDDIVKQFASDQDAAEEREKEKKKAAFAIIQLGDNPGADDVLAFAMKWLGKDEVKTIIESYDRTQVTDKIRKANPNLTDEEIEQDYARYCVEYVPEIKENLKIQALKECQKCVTDEDIRTNDDQIKTELEKTEDRDLMEALVGSDAAAWCSRNWSKFAPAFHDLTDMIPTLTAELVTILTLLKKRFAGAGLNLRGEEDFGGVHITSADRNVLVSSKTESRMVSDGDIVLRAMKSIAKSELGNSAKKSHKELAGEIRKNDTKIRFGEDDETHLLMSADNTYIGSLKKTQFLAADTMTLGSMEEIVLTTKKETLDLMNKDAHLSKKQEVYIKYDQLINTKYGNISLKQTEIEIKSQEGDAKKSTVDIKPDETTITVADGDDSESVSISKNLILIGNDDAVAYIGKNGEFTGFFTGGEKTSLILDDGGETFSLTANNGIDLNVGDDHTMTMNGDGITLTTSKDITLDATANINFKNANKINLCDVMKLDKEGSKINATNGMLKLEGNTIKLG